MGKVIEFESVYLEYPDELENTDEILDNRNPEEDEEKVVVESRTTKLSLEELQRKLEETQALHL